MSSDAIGPPGRFNGIGLVVLNVSSSPEQSG